MEECDLVMKGGITSGVVYPHAIAEIANRYRLRSIGGTSAGAIAATFAAAAEYDRQQHAGSMAGFDKIRGVSNNLAENLITLFQPSPKMKPLYTLMMAALEAGEGKSKALALLKASFTIFRTQWKYGAAVTLLGFVAAFWKDSCALALLSLVIGLLLSAGLIAWQLFTLISRDLPAEDYGVCPGRSQAGYPGQGFTDWMADQIDDIAANLGENGKPGKPLTVGQLQAHGIEIAAMTTDLSSGRPYQLPLKSQIHYFSKREFDALFPQRVMDYLVKEENRVKATPQGLPDDLYKLPVDADMPVLLVARLSLSFPGLIRAVPLYRHDDLLKVQETEEGEGKGHGKLRRCLFSDGGISSNFPVHFFDAFLPSRPTFGIMLTEYSEEHHGSERVNLPGKADTRSTALVVKDIRGFASFFMAAFNTAKDWQDTLQTKLPGHAERIVEVRLDPKEGGLNLSMPKETILRLGAYGRQAGQKLVNDFDFNEHRWRRALAFFSGMEKGLVNMAENTAKSPPGGLASDRTYADVLTTYDPQSYKNTSKWRAEVLKVLADDLAAVGEKARQSTDEKGHRAFERGKVPHIDARIRLIADANRVPADMPDP